MANSPSSFAINWGVFVLLPYTRWPYGILTREATTSRGTVLMSRTNGSTCVGTLRYEERRKLLWMNWHFPQIPPFMKYLPQLWSLDSTHLTSLQTSGTPGVCLRLSSSTGLTGSVRLSRSHLSGLIRYQHHTSSLQYMTSSTCFPE